MTLALFLTGLLLLVVAAVALVMAAITERRTLAALGWALFVAGVICWLIAIWTGAL